MLSFVVNGLTIPPNASFLRIVCRRAFSCSSCISAQQIKRRRSGMQRQSVQRTADFVFVKKAKSSYCSMSLVYPTSRICVPNGSMHATCGLERYLSRLTGEITPRSSNNFSSSTADTKCPEREPFHGKRATKASTPSTMV